VTVSDPSYNGSYNVSGCAGIVGYTSPSGSPITLTPQAAGTCTLTVSDGIGNQVTIPTSVSTLSVPVN
jgi:hypothetical protein